MSIIDALFNKPVNSYEEAFRAKDITSDWMQEAIKDWFGLYYQKDPTEKEDPCQQIPYTIVRKLTKTTFSEYGASSKDTFAQDVLNALAAKKDEAMQMALIGGECLLKPILSKEGFRFNVISRRNMLVFGRNEDGTISDIGTAETTAQDKCYYTLLERRTVDAYGWLTIRNTLYQSWTKNSLGTKVKLDTLPQYAALRDEYTFSEPVGSVGLVPMRTPVVNCVDGSHDAVSVYAAAVGLIHSINVNAAQLSGEFERGESRIIVDSDMLKKDKSGKRTFSDHIFTGVEGDGIQDLGVTIFSPALRVDAFQARETDYLRSVENVIGLKRGLLSEVEAAERTATEITSSAGEYNLTIIDFQQMWETAAKEALRVCGILGRLYRIPGAHDISEDQVTISWGNGVLFDEEKTRQRMLSEVSAGLLQPERYLGFTYKLPCDTAAQRAKIRKDYMPEVPDDPVEDE